MLTIRGDIPHTDHRVKVAPSLAAQRVFLRENCREQKIYSKCFCTISLRRYLTMRNKDMTDFVFCTSTEHLSHRQVCQLMNLIFQLTPFELKYPFKTI